MIVLALVISGRMWVAPVLAYLGISLWLVSQVYRKESADRNVRLACAALKLLGLLTLGLCVLEPLWTGKRARPGANIFVVLADNSQGMQIKDHGAAKSRGEELKHLLTAEDSLWNARLDENFQVRRYYFDSRLQSTRDFGELDFEGRNSSMGAALKNIAERYEGQPLSGVLVLTDGNATDLEGGKIDTTGLPPIYPVVIGKDEPIKDVALENVTAGQTAFEDAPVTVQANVTAAGYGGGGIVAQLIDADGKKVEEKSLRSTGGDDPLAFRFELKPEHSGVSLYRVRVSARDELGQFEHPDTSSEATLANNSRMVVVNRGQGPYRILYVAGRPKWEFKFMNRALAEDDQIQLVSLIRIAKREPKFSFRGRAGESSNPLFRGFSDQSEENVERYDQPVLVRLNTRDAAELVGGFPKTAEELYAYQAVVVDDIEADFFTRDQMTLLQKYVSERGGGFLMLGGPDAFHQGHYERTPIGDMLPVYLDHMEEGAGLKDAALTLTHEGWLQPWARLRNNEADERKRLNEMPPFQAVNKVRDLKPGASAIASVHDSTGHDYPALAVQRFGNGHVGALMIADLWRWGMKDEAMHRDMDKSWRQLFRWLISDVPNRVDFQAEAKKNDPNDAMRLQVRVRDKAFQPMDNVSVVISIRTVTNVVRIAAAGAAKPAPQTNQVLRLTAEPSSSEAGLYEATYIPRENGGYLAEAAVTDSAGAEVGRAQAGWAADPAANEFSSLKPNRGLLEQMARQTGGEVVSAEKLNDFAASLPNRNAPITEDWTYPIWDRPAVFLFALACLLAEWGLRRWKGMA